jgi:hypothetical protein
VASSGDAATMRRMTAKAKKNQVVHEEEEEEEDAMMRGLDASKVAMGSLMLFCFAAGVATIHPDAAMAREVTLELPDLPDFDFSNFGKGDFSDFTVPSSPMEFLRFLLSNPYAAVACSVAAYLVIPKAGLDTTFHHVIIVRQNTSNR